MVKFSDWDSIRQWAKRTDPEIAIGLAALSAARVMPMVSTDPNWPDRRGEFQVIRAVFISIVRGLATAPELDSSVEAANFNWNGSPENAAANAIYSADRNTSYAADVADTVIAARDALKPADLDSAQDLASALSNEGIKSVLASGIWGNSIPARISTAWAAIVEYRGPEREAWGFWIDWYQGLLDGCVPDIDMWLRVAQIPNYVWIDGPEAVAEQIRRITDEHQTDQGLVGASTLPDIDNSIAAAAIKQNILKNKKSLPPTLDAIEGLIAVEINRIQSNNYLCEKAPEFVQQSISSLLAIYDAVKIIQSNVVLKAEVTEEIAEETKSQFAVIWDGIKNLPTEKSNDIVQGVWETGVGTGQLGLIFGATTLAGSLGIPVSMAFVGSAMVIAPTKAAEIIKAGRDYLPKS